MAKIREHPAVTFDLPIRKKRLRRARAIPTALVVVRNLGNPLHIRTHTANCTVRSSCHAHLECCTTYLPLSRVICYSWRMVNVSFDFQAIFSSFYSFWNVLRGTFIRCISQDPKAARLFRPSQPVTSSSSQTFQFWLLIRWAQLARSFIMDHLKDFKHCSSFPRRADFLL